MPPETEASRASLIEDIAAFRRQVAALWPAAASARQAEAEFARLFAQSFDLLGIAGFDGYFKSLSPGWETLLGWKVDDLLARPFLDFVYPDDRQATLAEVDRLAGGAETILFENRYLRRDGSHRWLQWNARKVPGCRRIYATARDVTGRRRLEKEVLEIVDREKERLGRELHDGLCQTLAGIAALSSTLSRRLAENPESAGSSAATEISELLNDAIGEARDLAQGLGPLSDDRTGLHGALETLALGVPHRFRIPCAFECEQPPSELASTVEEHLYRIAQEAVNNALTHGRPRQIEISLSSRGRRGLLSVRDDGVGVAEEALMSDGLGMQTMKYRSHLIGGTLEVRRRSHGGTVVACAFPLRSSSDPG